MARREPAPIRAGALAFSLGLVTILAAWAFQILGGYVPCKLCLEERLAYYYGLPLILTGLILAVRSPALARLLYAVAGLVFLAGAALGAYHAGAEWGFWPGPTNCGGGVGPTTNAADLLSQMKNTRLVSCTEATWRLMGLSFAGWNMAVSAAVSALAFRAATTSHHSLI
jgi:disulfide bond formation protein DsbB